jgi:hypothetical protein
MITLVLRISRALPIALGCWCAWLSTAASAAPVTVNLRVEGSTSTLFEGPVSTEAILDPPGLSTTSSEGAHPCDVKDNGANEGFVPAAGNPTTALYDAAVAYGLAFNAKWSSSINDFFITQVGSDTEGGPPEYPAWGYAVNYATAHVGGCQFQLAAGSEVLWAYNYFNLPHLLSLTGPTSANIDTPFTVHVVDGQTGEPLAGAAIGEVGSGVTTTIPASPTTDSDGNATISLTHTGTVTLKATRAESVRSNGLAICVHDGSDGSCGTPTVQRSGGSTTTTTSGGEPSAVAELAEVVGVKSGHVYSRRHAPRVLKGVVKVPVGDTLRQTRILLERRHDGRCFNFSGSRESFVRARKCGTASFFSVGAAESFSYLLPAQLPAGRYVYDIDAIDNTGKITKLVSGVSHVVFRVK